MLFLPILSLGILILSLVGVLVSFQYFTHYQGLMLLERSHIVNQSRRMRVALSYVVLFSLVAVLSLAGILYPAVKGLAPTPAAPLPTGENSDNPETTAVSGATETAPAASPTAALPESTATPVPGLSTAVIGNTGGAGANIRSKPGLNGAIIDVLPEGTRVYVFDNIREVDGYTWRKIEMPDTRDGWIVVQFLILE